MSFNNARLSSVYKHFLILKKDNLFVEESAITGVGVRGQVSNTQLSFKVKIYHS